MSDSIVGVLLAAGRSSRFGSDKLLHPLADGTPVAVAAAANLVAACERVIAVVRPGNDELAGLLHATGCDCVICPSADAGMGYSLAAGVAASPHAGGWVVALADMPYITPASHRTIVASLRNGAVLAACEYHGERGHPVGFARHWFNQLSSLTGDQGGKSILQAHPQQLLHCPVDDPGVVWDIDRPDELRLYPHKPSHNGPHR